MNIPVFLLVVVRAVDVGELACVFVHESKAVFGGDE